MLGLLMVAGWSFIAHTLHDPLSRELYVALMVPAVICLLASGFIKFALRPASVVDQAYAWALALDDRQVANFISRMYPDGGLIEARDMVLISRYAAEVGHKAVSKAGAAQTLAPAKDVPEFDYAAGSQNDLFFRRPQGDQVFISVGRPDWMPVAAFMLFSSRERGQSVLHDALLSKTGLEQLRGYSKWCRESIKAMQPLMVQIEAMDTPRFNAGPNDFESPQGYDGLQALHAYDAFLVSWANCQNAPGGDWLEATDVFVAHLGLPELEAHRKAVEVLQVATMKWATSWLAASGLQVEQHQQLVHVPGYVPLVENYYGFV